MRLQILMTVLAMTAAVSACAHGRSFSLEAAMDGRASTDGEPRPFNSSRDAMADIDAALGRAKARGARVLLVLGANWCHDSRSLAAKFADPALAPLIAERYELVWVDVGAGERNLDAAARFGVPKLAGTPTVLVLSADGALLNAESIGEWRSAASRTLEETRTYFAALGR